MLEFEKNEIEKSKAKLNASSDQKQVIRVD